MKTVSIGYHREDGDFAVLATLNNNDGHMDDEDFEYVVGKVFHQIELRTNGLHLETLERQDAPDYVTPEGETQ